MADITRKRGPFAGIVDKDGRPVLWVMPSGEGTYHFYNTVFDMQEGLDFRASPPSSWKQLIEQGCERLAIRANVIESDLVAISPEGTEGHFARYRSFRPYPAPILVFGDIEPDAIRNALAFASISIAPIVLWDGKHKEPATESLVQPNPNVKFRLPERDYERFGATTIADLHSYFHKAKYQTAISPTLWIDATRTAWDQNVVQEILDTQTQYREVQILLADSPGSNIHSTILDGTTVSVPLTQTETYTLSHSNVVHYLYEDARWVPQTSIRVPVYRNLQPTKLLTNIPTKFATSEKLGAGPQTRLFASGSSNISYTLEIDGSFIGNIRAENYYEASVVISQVLEILNNEDWFKELDSYLDQRSDKRQFDWSLTKEDILASDLAQSPLVRKVNISPQPRFKGSTPTPPAFLATVKQDDISLADFVIVGDAMNTTVESMHARLSDQHLATTPTATEFINKLAKQHKGRTYRHENPGDSTGFQVQIEPLDDFDLHTQKGRFRTINYRACYIDFDQNTVGIISPRNSDKKTFESMREAFTEAEQNHPMGSKNTGLLLAWQEIDGELADVRILSANISRWEFWHDIAIPLIDQTIEAYGLTTTKEENSEDRNYAYFLGECAERLKPLGSVANQLALRLRDGASEIHQIEDAKPEEKLDSDNNQGEILDPWVKHGHLFFEGTIIPPRWELGSNTEDVTVVLLNVNQASNPKVIDVLANKIRESITETSPEDFDHSKIICVINEDISPSQGNFHPVVANALRDRFGFDIVSHGLSESHDHPESLLATSVATNLPIQKTRYIKLTQLNLTNVVDGITYTSDDKGVLVVAFDKYVLLAPHLLPFRYFDVDQNHSAVKKHTAEYEKVIDHFMFQQDPFSQNRTRRAEPRTVIVAGDQNQNIIPHNLDCLTLRPIPKPFVDADGKLVLGGGGDAVMVTTGRSSFQKIQAEIAPPDHGGREITDHGIQTVKLRLDVGVSTTPRIRKILASPTLNLPTQAPDYHLLDARRPLI